MNSSQSCRKLTRIQKQLSSLQLKKKKLLHQLASVQKQDDYITSLESRHNQYQQRQCKIKTELQLSRVRLGKLNQKLEQLQNQKINKKKELHDLSIKKQTLLTQAKRLYTHKISSTDQLRLELIEIQNSEELVDFSNIFSLRKSIIKFMKDKENNESSLLHDGLEVYLCKRQLVSEFEQFLMKVLQEKKLIQFKMTIKGPIKKYLQILKKIQHSFNKTTPDELTESEFIQLKGQEVIADLFTLERNQKEKIEQLLKIDSKIEKNKLKTIKYNEYVNELFLERERSVDEVNQSKNILQKLQRQKPLMRSLSDELEQITQAIDYLSAKILTSNQNLNCLNSPKTINIFNKFQDRFDSPFLLSFQS